MALGTSTAEGVGFLVYVLLCLRGERDRLCL